MGVQEPELFQKVAEQPGAGGQEAGNGWSKGYPMKNLFKNKKGNKILTITTDYDRLNKVEGLL
ncbi:hypothetical protein KJ693_02205 [bacterium]|nr:hypothetical protein [bacterium]MBU1614104.1 hypothetical protein [bacterium]